MPSKSITDPFLSDSVEDRIAEKTAEEPNWLEGKRRIIGAFLLALGLIGQFTGHPLPEDQIRGFWGWLEVNWDTLSYGAGLLIGIWGSLAAQFRHKKEVAVVKQVAKEAVAEAVSAKAELIDTKVELEVVKATNQLNK